MFFSLYPSDKKEAREAILKQAAFLNCSTFFTSLHIPEVSALKEFLDYLKKLHNENHLNFYADISPASFPLLGIENGDLTVLKQYGIIGLRLDYGLDEKDRAKFQEQGFSIAINASTITKAELSSFAPASVIGWHNYYPRPYTALCPSFLDEQNALLKKKGIPSWAYVPGTKYRRIPLFEGLPTLEEHRYTNAYTAWLELIRRFEIDVAGNAEGIWDEESAAYIKEYMENGIITIPINCDTELTEHLDNQTFRVRIEESGFSWRLEDTRKFAKLPLKIFDKSPENQMRFGGIYMDTAASGRYQGEIHICASKAPVPAALHKIGEVENAGINRDFTKIIPLLKGAPTIRFQTISL